MSAPASHVPHDASHAAPHHHPGHTDPHGSAHGNGHGHGHVIMSSLTLRAVLAVLLVFTVLTVGAANFEVWFQGYFDVVLPRWVNIAIAMSIATVKGALVLMFFMQLRYDNPINTIVFLFTMFAFSLFLGFTLLDLGNRGTLYAYKAGEAQKGGLGGISRATGEVNAQGEPVIESIAGPIVEHARKRYLDKLAADLGDMELAKAEFARQEAAAHAKNHSHHTRKPVLNTANTSRPRTGLTPGLYDSEAHSQDDHGAGHSSAGGH